MKDLDKVKKLIEKGYIIELKVPVKNIDKESVVNFYSSLSLKTDLDMLLDPANDDAYLILFRDLSKEFERVELLTSDKNAIYKTEEYYSFQTQPIGVSINAVCAALGSSSKGERIFHLNHLIPCMNNVFGWKFKLNDIPGTFTAEIKIYPTDRVKTEKSLTVLQNFLDALSITKNVGFHIQHYSIYPIPRCNAPYVSGMGPVAQIVEPLSQLEINKLTEIMQSNDKVKLATKGLNQSYVENLLPSRVARLWATVENIFDDEKPKKLLKKTEKKEIIDVIKNMENLNVSDTNMQKIYDGISNLHLENRNERIANNIAILMDISPEEALIKVKKASRIRGDNVHKITNNWEKLEVTEKFLQEILNKFIEDNKSKMSMNYRKNA